MMSKLKKKKEIKFKNRIKKRHNGTGRVWKRPAVLVGARVGLRNRARRERNARAVQREYVARCESSGSF